MNDTEALTIEDRTGDRSLTRRYVLPEEVASRRDETVQRAFEITTRHDKERKRYTVLVSRITVSERFVRWVMEFDDPAPFEPFIIPAERYSAKTLAATHADAVARVESDFSALAEWAGRAKVDI